MQHTKTVISSSRTDKAQNKNKLGKFPYLFKCLYYLLSLTLLLLTIILPVVLYGCDTWSLTLKEERKLRVFENMVLRRIFGPRRDEVTEEWRRLHN